MKIKTVLSSLTLRFQKFFLYHFKNEYLVIAAGLSYPKTVHIFSYPKKISLYVVYIDTILLSMVCTDGGGNSQLRRDQACQVIIL